MHRLLSRLRTDKSGNFGIMTAPMIMPLVGVAGLAIDFSNALNIRTELSNAADAAAIGAVAEKSPGVLAAMAMTGDGTVTLAQDDARKLFFGQASVQTQGVSVDVDTSLSRTSDMLTSRVTFNASVPTTFLKILGKDSISISGTATAQNETAKFMDFYILIDNSPSMGVGATLKEIDALESKTGCAFACHQLDKEVNNYTIAKDLKVNMRIDVVRMATQALAERAKTDRLTNDQFQMGVYTLGARAEDAQLTTISGLTSDMDQVKKYTSTVDLMTIPYQNYKEDQLTNFDDALTAMNGTIINNASQGATATDRKKILFIVSDGVGDRQKPDTCTENVTSKGRCQEPIDASFCEPLKKRGVQIAVLYTTYLPMKKDADNWYDTWIRPFHDDIAGKMEACATPGFYFEVSPSEGIDTAMNALFAKVVHAPRLTH